MTEASAERTRGAAPNLQFFLTGFSQTAGTRIYTFQGRVEARRIDYTVQVDLALLPVYGIQIQDLPLLCRELLQQRAQPDEINAFVFTEQRMCSHAEQLSLARNDAEQRKKHRRHLDRESPETSGRSPFS